MRSEYLDHNHGRPVWATPVATAILWTAVIALAVAGLFMLTVHGDTGVLLMVAAMIVAAPAAAATRYRNTV